MDLQARKGILENAVTEQAVLAQLDHDVRPVLHLRFGRAGGEGDGGIGPSLGDDAPLDMKLAVADAVPVRIGRHEGDDRPREDREDRSLGDVEGAGDLYPPLPRRVPVDGAAVVLPRGSAGVCQHDDSDKGKDKAVGLHGMICSTMMSTPSTVSPAPRVTA